MPGKIKASVVAQFIAVTGVSKPVAYRLLEACNGNLDRAINMHMDENESAGASSSSAADDLRAPIPQVTEQLVEQQPVYGFKAKKQKRKSTSVFDGFRNFEAEARQQELYQQSQNSHSTSSRSNRKTKTLEELFRPPIDLLHRGSFLSARDLGSEQQRWVLVNIQNVTEFPCQVLNRDVWSNSNVREFIKERFVFWQVYHDTDEGEKYTQFYPVTDWPYVAIIDPRTGEKMIEWNQIDAITFCDLISNFLVANPYPGSSTANSSTTLTQPEKNAGASIIDHSEDSQLQAALAASMTDVASSGPAAKKRRVSNDNKPRWSSDKPRWSPEIFTHSGTSEEGSDELETFTDSEEEPLQADDSPLSSSPPVSPTGKGSKGKKSSSSPGKRPKSPINGKSPRKTLAANTKVSSSPGKKTAATATRKSRSPSKSPGKDTETAQESRESPPTVKTCSPGKEPWRRYLGKKNDEKTTILFRFPDGQRQQFTVPRTSKLRALTEFANYSGFSHLKHELLTNFPRRNLSQLDQSSTLETHGLFPQETVFVNDTTPSS